MGYAVWLGLNAVRVKGLFSRTGISREIGGKPASLEFTRIPPKYPILGVPERALFGARVPTQGQNSLTPKHQNPGKLPFLQGEFHTEVPKTDRSIYLLNTPHTLQGCFSPRFRPFYTPFWGCLHARARPRFGGARAHTPFRGPGGVPRKYPPPGTGGSFRPSLAASSNPTPLRLTK